MKNILCGGKKDSSSPDTIYGLGLIGALVFYVQNSTGIVGFIVAILKSIVWPAFLVYELFSFLS